MRATTTHAAPAVWMATSIPDQTGRTIVVTGANSGLGEATTRALVHAGARVIMACRDTAKAEMVAGELGDAVQIRRLDLANLASVRKFAEGIEELDVLINNAGIMAVPYRRTVDEFEMHIGTNHLGHFALTGLLLPNMRDRVVTVASTAHYYGKIDTHDLNWDARRYRRMAAYSQSKLANLLFAYELQRKLTATRSPVRSVAAHPGWAATSMQSRTGSAALNRVLSLGNRLFSQSAEMGALSLLHAATGDVEPGGYYGPTRLGGWRGYPELVGSSRASRSPADARELWTQSERLTDITYGF